MKIAPRFTRIGIQTLAAIAIASLSMGITPAIAQTKPTISVPDFKNDIEKYKAQDARRRENTQDVLKLE